MHRLGMPEGVRTDVLRRVWEGDAGARGVLDQEIAYARAREALPTTIGEEGGIQVLGPAQPLLLHIRLEQRDGTGHEGYHPPFPAFANQLHVRRALEPHGTGRERDQLLHPRPRIIQEAEENGISSPSPGGQVGLLEDRRDSLWGEIPHHGWGVFVAGEGQNLLTLQQIVWRFGLEITKEGMEGREALIAGARRPLAFRRRG